MIVRKICVVVTARPSYSRVQSVLRSINKHPLLDLQLVVAGSALLDKYGNAATDIAQDGFDIAERVYVVIEGETPTAMAKTTGLAVIELSSVFFRLKPDVVLAIADRFETIAVSIAAAYQNICLAHLQGGEVTGNIDEKVRHSNTKMADLHLVSSEDARQRVIRLGEDPEFVFNTGCPSIDLATAILQEPELNFDPFLKYGGVGNVFDLAQGYLVVLQHPVTTEPHFARRHIEATLQAVSTIGLPTFVFWPNMDAGAEETAGGIRAFRENHDTANMHFFKSFHPLDFLRLIYNAKCLVGNSSVGIRECSFYGVPVVNIGSRQSGRVRGPNVVDVSHDKDEIVRAVKTQITLGRYASSSLYGDAKAGPKIAEILATVPLRYHKTIIY